MDKFELTEEQKRQGQQALQAGEKRVHVTCTPEQHEYMEKRKREADLEFERERDRLRLDRLEAAVEKMSAQLARLTGESE